MRVLVLVSLLAVAGCGVGSRCEKHSPSGEFCVPDGGVAPAGAALTLEIREPCGGCGSASYSCTATRDGGRIEVALSGQRCEAPPGAVCSAACALRSSKCEVPPLEEGDYTVTSPGQPSQVLRVRDAGTTSCSAPFF